MFNTLRSELNTFIDKDPAAKSRLEVLLLYSGFHAILFHRIANFFYRHHIPLIPRAISQLGRFLTGIEIHPAAKIGQGLFIDHGMGVVIGETTIIGNDVLLYQGVTLGGTGKQKGKRHPTLGNNVVVGAGAKILGAVTIGDNVKVGAGSVVVKSVPANTTVVGVPGRIVVEKGRRLDAIEALEHGHLPDPEAQAIKQLLERVTKVENKVNDLSPKKEKSKASSLKEKQDKIDEFISGAGI